MLLVAVGGFILLILGAGLIAYGLETAGDDDDNLLPIPSGLTSLGIGLTAAVAGVIIAVNALTD